MEVPSNAPWPIVLNVDGNSIFFRFAHPLNAFALILSSPSFSVTVSRFLQFSNVFSSMDLTFIVAFVNPEF